MRNTRRRSLALLAIIMAMVMSLVSCASALAYPTEWALDDIYASEAEWQADFDRIGELIQGHSEYRGKLDNADTIYEYYERFYMGELTKLQQKTSLYAYLCYSLDSSNASAIRMKSLDQRQTSEELQLSAFVAPEIYELPLDERIEIFSQPRFEPLSEIVSGFMSDEDKGFSEETSDILAEIQKADGRESTIFDILSMELPYPEMTMPDGTEIVMDINAFSDIYYGDYDRDLVVEAYKVLSSRTSQCAGTYAALLESHMSNTLAQAHIYDSETVREFCMSENGVPVEIFDLMLDAVHEGVDDVQRYLKLRSSAVVPGQQYPMDLAISPSEFWMELMEYDDGVDTVRAALSVLGNEYISVFDRMVSSGHIDVFPSKTKTIMWFSTSSVYDGMPYMMLHYDGSDGSVATLAHELGHSICTTQAVAEQGDLSYSTPAFLQEIPSTLNELLYYNYMINSAESVDEKLYYLDGLLITLYGNLFMQAMYAEFEDDTYAIIEDGGALSADMLNEHWESLREFYFGDGMYFASNTGWAEIPHFYMPYYVYQYATSMCYSAALCSAILSGDEDTVANYSDFLKNNSCDDIVTQLTELGIDPLSSDTYSAAISYFSSLVDEYEALLAAA